MYSESASLGFNIFWKTLFIQSKNDKKEEVPSQRFIDINELKQKFKKYFNENDKIIVYCNTGSEGSVAVFIMKFLFGWKVWVAKKFGLSKSDEWATC